MTDLVKNYIGGRWVEGRSGQTFETSNPATLEVIAPVVRSGTQDVADAVAAAKSAYSAWRLTPAPRRGELLFKLALILTERKDDLARLMTQEMGKTVAETRGDVQEAIDMAYYMGGEGRRLKGYTAPVEMPNKFGMALRDSVGIVGLITPWNFPVAVPSWKMLPALVAGNTVVWKPSEDTPASSAMFVQAFIDAGFPAGVVNLVLGYGDAGAALTEHPDVRILSFTGSTTTGLAVYSKAAALGKKVTLEMGGKNAIIVLDDANLDLAVDAITWSAYGTTGQRCTACSRLIVQSGIRPKLTEALLAKAKTLVVGDGLKEGVTVGPLVNQKALDKVSAYMDVARQDGADLLIGGGRDTQAGPGYFFQPTLFGGVTPAMRIAREEIFGPVLSMIEVGSLEEAVQVNNDSAYGLSSSIFTENVNKAFQAIRDLTTGIVYINHGTTGAEIQFPFGGTRGTGNGMREAGQAGLDSFTEWKSVYVDFSGRLQRAQIDTDAVLSGDLNGS
ncbi:MAG: aldehyde dehydrogenase family protein [Chloroflexi bacterium]|nr:aldehyde dehydrogenase family protein [Chloroflexota bacterium]MBV6435835.1 Aldehyde dehydrogenase, thermostable [Anaerolineae bacterium]MDL1915965.1 aldehyde dehydrogenase family protein [Anaerolineae bacterium CFX4]NOG49874.1 aldehyde dehydrogenase family protein [Chloroflexota bacterium]RIK20204.1 MAG: aldehyde dehydrogenase [Chloroflexota bacterium]